MNDKETDIRGWLAVLILIGGGALLLYGDEKLQMGVSNMMMAAIGYYFGSSQSNKDNRKTIDKMVDVQSEAAKALADKVVPTVVPQKVEITNTDPVAVKIEPLPPWVGDVAYNIGDRRTYSGTTYVSLTAHGPRNVTPDADPPNWTAERREP